MKWAYPTSRFQQPITDWLVRQVVVKLEDGELPAASARFAEKDSSQAEGRDRNPALPFHSLEALFAADGGQFRVDALDHLGADGCGTAFVNARNRCTDFGHVLFRDIVDLKAGILDALQ